MYLTLPITFKMNTWAEQRVNGNFLGVQEREAKVDVHH